MKHLEMRITDVMLERAGITSELISAGMDDPIFDEILEGMKLIHKGKETLYGHYVETHGSDPTLFALMEHFADLKRKYVRSEQFMKKRMGGIEIDMYELLDTYSDMAVYAAMGVQLVQHLMIRDKHREHTPGNDKPVVDEPNKPGASSIVDPDKWRNSLSRDRE